MTITKAQRGDVLEGWNDCPPLMIPSNNSSSSSLNKSSRRRIQRVGHNLNGGTSRTVIQTDSSTVSLNSSSTSLSSIKLPNTLDSKPSNISSISAKNSKEIELTAESIVDASSFLQKLLEHSTDLPEKELAHYRSKLTKAYSSLSGEHKSFFINVLSSVYSVINGQNNQDISMIKQDIVTFMIVNDGVSSWCSPLKKVIEGLNFT